MLSALRSRLTYANVVATLALVFAMSGGALAARHYLITSTGQISPKVIKKLKGREGPAGKEGKAGADGREGPAGKEGKAGADGVSVTGTESKTAIGPCKEGGSEFVAAKGNKTYACNGEKGPTGQEGNIKATLSPGKTETGMWSFSIAAPVFEADIPLSFPIPLSAEISESHIHFLQAGKKQANEGEGCYKAGSVSNPMAEPGNLCIYTGTLEGVENVSGELDRPFAYLNSTGGKGIGPTGEILEFIASSEGRGTGDWAVTEEKGAG